MFTELRAEMDKIFLVGFIFTFPSCCIAHVTFPFRKLLGLHLITNYDLKWIIIFQFFFPSVRLKMDQIFLVGFMFRFPSCCIVHVTFPFRKLLGLHLITDFELKWTCRFQFLFSFCSFENGFKGFFSGLFTKKKKSIYFCIQKLVYGYLTAIDIFISFCSFFCCIVYVTDPFGKF